MTIKHHYLKVLGNYHFHFPLRPPTQCVPLVAPCSVNTLKRKKRDDIQLDPQLYVPSPSLSMAWLQSLVSPRAFRPSLPDPSRELRALLVGLGMKGDLTATGLEGEEVFHIKLSHMAIITSPPRWVLGTQGSWQPGREAQKVHVDKILSSTIALRLESISQGFYKQQGGWFYKEAYCTVFSGTWCHAAPARAVKTWAHFIHTKASITNHSAKWGPGTFL